MNNVNNVGRNASRHGSSDINNNKKKKKANKKAKIIWLSILAVIVILIAAIWIFIASKLSQVQGDKLNENDLGLNKDIYNEVAETVSKEQFESVDSIAVFGVDGGRSDTIMILSVNQTTKGIKMISIPRDTYVSIEGHGKTKINHAYAYGKEQLAVKTINSNFGLNVKEYVTVDFKGLINVINKMGGVTVKITEAERQYINEFSHESYALTGKKVKKVTKTGDVSLDGEQALTHARNRTVGNDFTREERQRDVIDALIKDASKLSFNKLLEVIDGMLSDVRTNVDVTSYIPLLTTLLTQKDEYLNNIISTQIPASTYSGGKMIDGVYYYTTDYDKAKKDFLQYIYEK